MSCVGGVSNGNLVIKPFLSPRTAGKLLRKLYGLEAKCVKELRSYCDQNFLVQISAETEGGEDRNFVLKVINTEDALHRAGCYREIASVLLLLRTTDGVMYPKPVINLLGDYLSLQKCYRDMDGAYGLFLIMLLTYVPGTILSEVPLSNQLLFTVGRAVGNLNRELLDYEGPFEHLKARGENDKWCLTSVADVRPFLHRVPDAKHRLLAASVLDTFLREVKPLENNMRKGVIHVDVNRDNILVMPVPESTNQELNNSDDGHVFHQSGTHVVSGIIDFNDMAYECLVYDVAGSLMDIMIGRKDEEPLVAAGCFLAGYTSVIPLSTPEWQSVYVATAARLVQILALSHEYFHRSGNSDEYIMRQVYAGGWEVLKEMWETPKWKVQALWRELSIGRA